MICRCWKSSSITSYEQNRAAIPRNEKTIVYKSTRDEKVTRENIGMAAMN